MSNQSRLGEKTAPAQTDRGRAVDLHVGMRLRLRRLQLGADAHTVANMLSITLGEYHRLENGDQRLSPYLLLKASTVLEVPVLWFFDGSDLSELLPDETSEEGQAMLDSMVANLSARERGDLLLSYFNVLPPRAQQVVIEMTRALANDSTKPK
jgi:transcriptional regulator with XRE-family HTH domain